MNNEHLMDVLLEWWKHDEVDFIGGIDATAEDDMESLLAHLSEAGYSIVPTPASKPAVVRCRYPENGGGGHVEYCNEKLPCYLHNR